MGAVAYGFALVQKMLDTARQWGEDSPMQTNTFKPGQTVKWASPIDADDAECRFVVLEIRGDDVLAEYVCTMNIKPIGQYRAMDLIEA